MNGADGTDVDDLDGSASVCVVGAGTMGYGIGVAFAIGGWQCRLYDVDPTQLTRANRRAATALDTLAEAAAGPATTEGARAARDRLSWHESLPEAAGPADLVVEAVSEELETKQAVFSELEPAVGEDTVLASNTSSLPLPDIASTLSKPDRFLGTHWFNPPHIVPVVEVVRIEPTTTETVRRTRSMLEAIGKRPVTLERPIQGFIGNRIQSAMAHEAWSLLEAGIASAEDIDTAVKGTFGFRLPVMGVFEKGDDSGLDVHHRVLAELLPEIDRGTEPAPILSELVEAGRLGRKAGAGVYQWDDAGADPEAIDRARDRRLLEVLDVFTRASRDPGPDEDMGTGGSGPSGKPADRDDDQ